MNNAATATARTASPVRKLTYSALYLALAMVLPFLTGQIPEIGSTRSRLYLPAAALDVRHAADLDRYSHGV